jgi:hypothetical protein
MTTGVSAISGVVAALVVGGPTGWMFALVGPLMAVAVVTERFIERRESARALVRQALAVGQGMPSALTWCQAVPVTVTWWQAGLSRPPEALTRLGERRIRERDLAPGAGSGFAVVAVLIDLDGGLELRGDAAVSALVLRALRVNRARVYDPSDRIPPLVVDGGAHGEGALRWRLLVDAGGRGLLHDRLGREPDIGDIQLDVLDERFDERITAVESAALSVEVHALDLAVDGPHALVSGVTGSGKTEFLIAWLTAMAEKLSWDQLAIAIIDFKGGGSFARLAGLPHLRHLVTDLDLLSVEFALEGMQALVSAREALLAQHGVPHIDDLPAAAAVPRAVIVVDEFRALTEALPPAARVLNDVAARGRALGIHLVLSTQRFAAAASDGLVANCNLRVVFRAGDHAESVALLGVGTAFTARMPPGHALVSRGRGVEALRFSPVPLDAPTAAPERAAKPRGLWLEPLGCRPRPSDFMDAHSQATLGDELVLGVRDDHASLTRKGVAWSPTVHGVLLVIGGSGMLRRDLSQVFAEVTPEALVLDGSAALAWDDLSRGDGRSGLVVPALDSLVARLPPAWRDEFVDRVLSLTHDLSERAQPVCLGFASEGGLSARFQQLTSSLAHVRDDERGLIEFQGALVQCFGVCDRAWLQTEPSRQTRPTVGAWLAEGPAPVMLITPKPGAWRSLSNSGLRVVPPEVVMAESMSAAFAPPGRILIDGCSPAEFRAMRLTNEMLPPPMPGTLMALTEVGAFERLWLNVQGDTGSLAAGDAAR